MQFRLSLVELIFNVLHKRWMPLNHIDKFAHFLILLLQVIPQRLIVLE